MTARSFRGVGKRAALLVDWPAAPRMTLPAGSAMQSHKRGRSEYINVNSRLKAKLRSTSFASRVSGSDCGFYLRTAILQFQNKNDRFFT